LANAQSKGLNANLHVGTMGWSYSFWKGTFYTEDAASQDFLSFYANRFNSVEADSTFYRIPRTETITDWKQQTPDKFYFSLKFPQKITHIKMLQDCQEETRVFLERATLLGDKLGALLLQFPAVFRQQHLPLLRTYLMSLPEGLRYVVEVRNKSLLNDELYALLRENHVALAWVDAAKMPLTDKVTSDFLYIRWEGDRKTVIGTLGKREADRKSQIQQWAEKLKTPLKQGMQVFGYFSKYYSGFPPSDVEELLKNIVL
jgi:uncharacterized protein YecE (DUF72 family)